MMGNYLVRFLGGDGGASLPTYPVANMKFTEIEQKVIFLKAINQSIDLRMLCSGLNNGEREKRV